MKVLILASGTASRMINDAPKQLLPVNGEAVIRRTIRQIKHVLSIERVWVVTRNKKIMDSCLDCNIFYVSSATNCTCATLAVTYDLWNSDSEVLVVLGDVFFTDAAIHAMSEKAITTTWFTDTRDIFAMKAARTSSDHLINSANSVSLENPLQNEGRLWQAYFKMDDSHKRQCMISDETQDFDTKEDYDNFLNGITKNKLLGKYP